MGGVQRLLLRFGALVVAALGMAGGLGLVLNDDIVSGTGGILAGVFFAFYGILPRRRTIVTTGRDTRLLVNAVLLALAALVYGAAAIRDWPKGAAFIELVAFAFLTFAALVLGKNSDREWRDKRARAVLASRGGEWVTLAESVAPAAAATPPETPADDPASEDQ